MNKHGIVTLLTSNADPYGAEHSRDLFSSWRHTCGVIIGGYGKVKHLAETQQLHTMPRSSAVCDNCTPSEISQCNFGMCEFVRAEEYLNRPLM